MIDREGRGGEEEERKVVWREAEERRGEEEGEVQKGRERRKGQMIRVPVLGLGLVLDRIRGTQRVQSRRAGARPGQNQRRTAG